LTTTALESKSPVWVNGKIYSRQRYKFKETLQMEENIENQDQNSQPSQPQATPPQPEQASPEPAQPAPEIAAVSQDSKNMGMLCHLLGIFTGFLGPLILWLIKKDDDKFVDSQGKEALNFQITVIFAVIASYILMIVFIGILLLPATFICNLIFCIMGSVAASKGQNYKYPVCIRLIK
jgi:uncharacterized protein